MRLLLVVTSILGAAVVATVVLLWVPIAQEQSGYTMLGFTLYTFETVNIFSAPWENFTFHGVTFEFTRSNCPQNPGGGNVCGGVLESSGATYGFDISFPPPCRSWGSWLTWMSPDHNEAIEFETCSNSQATHLLVRA